VGANDCKCSRDQRLNVPSEAQTVDLSYGNSSMATTEHIFKGSERIRIGRSAKPFLGCSLRCWLCTEVGVFVMNNYTYSRVMAVYYYNQYNLYMYDLCMFIRYLVSITQVIKDT
jgi:hypothetical protein